MDLYSLNFKSNKTGLVQIHGHVQANLAMVAGGTTLKKLVKVGFCWWIDQVGMTKTVGIWIPGMYSIQILQF